MPQLNKSSSKRRPRLGDRLAVLLLLVIGGALGWFWWHQKHPKKILQKKPATILVAPETKISAPQPEKIIGSPTNELRPPPVQILPPGVVTSAPPQLILVTNLVPAKAVVPEKISQFSRGPHDVFEAQIALARRGISPGSLDGAIGSQTRAAIAAFQRSQKLFESSSLDTNTRALLALAAPIFTTYAVTTNDLARLQPIGKTWVEKSQQTALDYETILELVAEKAHAHPLLIQKLNPGVDWSSVTAGTVSSACTATSR